MESAHCLVLVLSTLASLTQNPANAKPCDPGWFGHICHFRCRCQGNVPCATTGQCPANVSCFQDASVSYFGPFCQYEDVLKVRVDRRSHAALTDQDDLTCVGGDLQVVEIHLTSSTPFLWFRLVTNNEDYTRNFNVSLNNGEICRNMRLYSVSPMVVDVFCDNNILLTVLNIRGPVVPYICSIRLTSGRNVALRQQTAQSSTKTGLGDSHGLSMHGVDGLFEPISLSDHDIGATCVITSWQVAPWWEVTFQYPQVIGWVVVLTMKSAVNNVGTVNNMKDFNLKTIDPHGKETHHFVDSKTSRPVYTIIFDSPKLSSKLRIYFTENMSDRNLLICEVIAYGDIWCPDGTYGLWCQHSCTCGHKQSCHTVTGACSNPCPQGTYGHGCQLNCSSSCLEHFCQERSGRCYACSVGYMGANCEKACPSGHHGINCTETCSGLCPEEKCNPITGYCDFCPPNFQGPYCQDCTDHFFGENCSDHCPEECKKHLCERYTGYCLECSDNHLGHLCQECDGSFYGIYCNIPCPINCLNQSCHPQLGTCYECEGGQYGSYCSLAMGETTLIVITVLVFLVAAAGAFFFLLHIMRKTSAVDKVSSSSVISNTFLDSAIGSSEEYEEKRSPGLDSNLSEPGANDIDVDGNIDSVGDKSDPVDREHYYRMRKT